MNNSFTVYNLDAWKRDLNSDFTLKDFLFGNAYLSAKKDDSHKYVYSGIAIGFNSRLELSLPDRSVGKHVIIFGVHMSSSLHIDNKKKDILVLSKGPTQGLDDTMLTAEAQFLINFSRTNRKLCLSRHYNGSNILFI